MDHNVHSRKVVRKEVKRSITQPAVCREELNPHVRLPYNLLDISNTSSNSAIVRSRFFGSSDRIAVDAQCSR